MAQTPQPNNPTAPRRGALAYILNPPTSEADLPGRSSRTYQGVPSRTAYVPGGDNSRTAPVQQSYGAVNPTGGRGRDAQAPPAQTQQNMDQQGRPPAVMLPGGLPVPSASLSAPRPSTNHRVHLFRTSVGVVQYIYVGSAPRGGRNVLERVEDMSVDTRIQSFGPYNIVCAGCNKSLSTRNGRRGKYYNDRVDAWANHHCRSFRDWKDPASPSNLTPEMAAEFARSRMVSRDDALADLVEQTQIERVYY
ncbi:hypothetical protein BD626DRAFT_566279 [Schizophyllum amplum]|uniref:Uncharacterized protein n=1 Tax=Schizophyllum amplum TaxID=97359 RepID=A0A550CRA0_9AGAR|nr:hypothetical protein BD626DRAFT_566279 [Auriculariopsis ampla]